MRLLDDIRLAVLTGVTVTWLASLALLWALSGTPVLAAASQHMPLNADGLGHQALTGGAAAQVLSMLTVALPALLIMLIAAGALHRPRLSDNL